MENDPFLGRDWVREGTLEDSSQANGKVDDGDKQI